MRLIDADALKRALTSDEKDIYVFVCLSRVLEKIDDATTINPCKDCDLYFKAMTIKAMQEAKRQNERI